MGEDRSLDTSYLFDTPRLFVLWALECIFHFLDSLFVDGLISLIDWSISDCEAVGLISTVITHGTRWKFVKYSHSVIQTHRRYPSSFSQRNVQGCAHHERPSGSTLLN